MKEEIPLWILIYAGATAAMPIVFGVIAYFNPGFQFGTWPALEAPGGTSVAGPMGLYIGRNIAAGLIMAFALWKRSVPMLVLAFMLRILTDLFDFAHLFTSGDLASGLLSAVLIVATGVVLFFLMQRKDWI